jgi:poly(3-hydroxybutyrate) depolymerase
MSIRRSPLAVIAAAAILITAAGVTVNGHGGTAVAAAGGTLAATAGCGRTPSLTSGTHTIQSGGQNRTYILRIPDGYSNTHPYRLIFGLHWLNGTANNVASAGYYGLQPLSNNSTIFVAPQGIDNGWANSASTRPSCSPWAGATAAR